MEAFLLPATEAAPAELPPGAPVRLVHGLRDEQIDIEHSRRLAAATRRTT